MKHVLEVLEPDFSAGIDAVGPSRPSAYARFGKRALDIALTLIALPAVCLILLLCVIVVRQDGGPAFYSQSRVGRDGKVFRLWKLRSMAVDAEERLLALCASDPAIAREWAVNQKLVNDPRITRFGCFIRKTSIDELPQLWNVLKGDMSLVGPRPFMLDQTELYVGAGGRAYFSLRPGLTGIWQVYGRGQTSFEDRVAFDERYAANTNLAGDVALILKTANRVLTRSGH